MDFLRKLLDIPPKPTPAEIDQALREIFDFTDADLKANHEGRMSAKQHYWFIDRFLRTVILSIGISVGGGLLFFSILRADNSFGAWPPYSLWGLFIGIGMVAWIIYSIFNIWQMLIDMVMRKVDVIAGKGRAYKYMRPRQWTASYKLVIKQDSFDVPKKAFSYLTNDEYYTIYFTPRSRVILAIEVG